VINRHLAGVVAAVSLGLAALSAAPHAAASSEESVTGLLEVVHADDFDHDRASHTYRLLADDGAALQLRFGDDGPHGLGGQRVTMHGQRHGSSMAVAQSADAQPAGGSGPAAAPAPGETRFAVVLLRFADAELKVTQPQVASLVFDSAVSTAPTVESFYRDNSYGRLDINGQPAQPAADVYNTVTISARSTDNCAYQAWGDEARAVAAEQQGFVDANYTHVAHIMPKNTCTFGGISQLPGKYTWDITDGVTAGDPASERRLRGLIEHELGHNLAAYHGASYACTDNRGRPVILGQRCTHSEYGDPFTVMGYSRGERTFNAFQKGRVSWYTGQDGQERTPWLDLSSKVSTVTTSTSADVTLAPLDAPAQGVQVLRVPMPSSRGYYYYVELRSGAGYDTYDGARDEALEGSKGVTGVTIRYAPDFPNGAATRLLDMHPLTSTFTDAMLEPGESFTDGGTTISNTTGAGVTGSATIKVTITATRGKGK
jgi:hypothetical protein